MNTVAGSWQQSSGRTGDLPEKLVVRAWQQLPSAGKELITEEGEPVRIIYPGRINSEEGPDLLDAVIATGHGLLIGAVEVHVRSSGWWSHGHQRDALYNQVVLHAVYRHDAQLAACLENGKHIPTLAIHKYVNHNLFLPPQHREADPASPCRFVRKSKETVSEILDAAGEERFLGKAAVFREDLAGADAGQVLYAGIMGALGYSRNQFPFLELARRLPLDMLETAAGEGSSDASFLLNLQALLMGNAGLLPSQRSIPSDWCDDWVQKLEQVWADSGMSETMSAGDWHLFRVRPANFPVRRLAAMSYLLLHWRRQGLLKEAINIISKTAREQVSSPGELLTVATEGYWADHYDFGKTARSAGALIGRGRAADIAVNVLLDRKS
ncbi:MAG: DUF2851 family protein, partial [Dehalococcoidales bacterium]|nr:DUF2851 family protein [Dehalococcoidales bacterium]